MCRNRLTNGCLVEKSVNRTHRKRFAFGLRALFALTTVAAFIVRWGIVEAQVTERELDLASEIEVLGGGVHLNTASWPESRRWSDSAAKWIAVHTGSRCFSRILSVELCGVDASTELMRKLAELRELQSLSLVGETVTDQTLDLVRHFRSLQVLHLTGTRTTEDGARRLKRNCPWLLVYESG
jgi:hypothetical protein